MEKEVFEGYNEDVQFVTPDVTQLIKLYEGRANYTQGHIIAFILIASDLGMFLEPLSLQQKQLIFLAVNNNESVHHAGGSHW